MSVQMKLLQKIFKMTQTELLSYLPKYLKSNGYNKITSNKDFIFAKGEIPVLLVAHLDTVHKELPTEIYYDNDKKVMWSPQGLGADDRAGVYGILNLLKHKPYILFTTDEEIGGLGAEQTIKRLRKNKLRDVNLIIELDRQGKNDCVFYDNDNYDFIKYIESFDFKENYGSFSDISILCPAWNISGVNLSIGYYNAHTKQEYLKLDELLDTLNKIEKIFDNLPNKRYEYIEIDYKKYGKMYSTSYYNKYNTEYDYSEVITNKTNDNWYAQFDNQQELDKNYFFCDTCMDYVKKQFKSTMYRNTCVFCENDFNKLENTKINDNTKEIISKYCKNIFKK
jgi:hypothetical protein